MPARVSPAPAPRARGGRWVGGGALAGGAGGGGPGGRGRGGEAGIARVAGNSFFEGSEGKERRGRRAWGRERERRRWAQGFDGRGVKGIPSDRDGARKMFGKRVERGGKRGSSAVKGALVQRFLTEGSNPSPNSSRASSEAAVCVCARGAADVEWGAARGNRARVCVGGGRAQIIRSQLKRCGDGGVCLFGKSREKRAARRAPAGRRRGGQRGGPSRRPGPRAN